MADKPKKKIRTEFRKKHESRTRKTDLTRAFHEHGFEDDETAHSERVSGKGELTRKRTIIGDAIEHEDASLAVHLEIDESVCLRGRVLRVHGLQSFVRAEQTGDVYRCATRRLLKSLSTEQRHVVVAGDHVIFRPDGDDEGFIERIDPRHGILSRTSKGRQHVLVANVDQLVIVASAAEPMLKPNLIDRFLVTAEKGRIRPVICINKIDLVHAADLQPLAGVYGQMGYRVVLMSATTGQGVAQVRQLIQGKESVVAGQSGVGKSSLLNAIDPGLELRVNTVSEENQKGRHTTTTAQLIPLTCGGYIVDTPGIRQFQLWDVIPEEVAGYYRDIRPYVSHCRFPNCTHTHEIDCAVKDAVADGRLDARRYESYCYLHAGDLD
ncbi:MAG: ribosome small subunit-dependent GTPase A [Planctomycetaceae bacterium]|nr:ribosome small subunit-dependent GTPase A [Planctomycetales bacterium]MCB9923481.1 ribosome small subunit-dependent GTPase A [Planctomycetaceae bacterium]